MSFFVATRKDMEPGLMAAEQQLRLKYIPCLDYPSPDYTVYYSALDIPELGTTKSPYVCSSPATHYLVFERDAEVNVERVAVNPEYGDSYYKLEHKANPYALKFYPGGWYTGDDNQGEHLMGGCLSTVYEAPQVAEETYKLFDKALTHKFKRLKATIYGRRQWRVGPEAYVALERGVRLVTERIDWPAEDDVQLPAK